jgi:hypothetical protein
LTDFLTWWDDRERPTLNKAVVQPYKTVLLHQGCLCQTHSTHKAKLDALLTLRFQTFEKTQFVPV